MVLTWDPPSDEGGRSDTQYKVECDVCSLHIAFSPQFPSGQTNVTLSHLQQGSTYNIKIFAMNGVSNISLDTENYAEVSVSTGSGAPSVVSNLMISDQKPHQLSLSWLPPTDPLLEIDLYEVRYFVRGQKANMSNLLITKNEMIEIPKLTEGTEYGLQVRARTNRGWGEFSSPLYAKTHSEVDPVFMGADKVGLVVYLTKKPFRASLVYNSHFLGLYTCESCHWSRNFDSSSRRACGHCLFHVQKKLGPQVDQTEAPGERL